MAAQREKGGGNRIYLNPFQFIFLLLCFQGHLNQQLLQLLVAVINAELLKASGRLNQQQVWCVPGAALVLPPRTKPPTETKSHSHRDQIPHFYTDQTPIPTQTKCTPCSHTVAQPKPDLQPKGKLFLGSSKPLHPGFNPLYLALLG